MAESTREGGEGQVAVLPGRGYAVVAELACLPGVTPPAPRAAFGSTGLKVRDKLCAMLVRGQLVVKLPKERVDGLIAAGEGDRYDPRRDGRLMKEWLVLAPTSREDWLALAREVLGFVAGSD